MNLTVITTSYNYEQYISQTVESVLNQTYKDFEYIIFDDGSTDNSLEIIKKYALNDSRIKLYTHENNENKGLIDTINEAVKKASGDYIIFVESDDTISSDYIEKKLNALKKHPDAAVIFNLINPIGDEQRILKCKKYLKTTLNTIYSDSFNYKLLLKTNIIPTFSCTMVKKDILLNIPFDFEVPKCFDWYLWNYIFQNYTTVFINEPLTTFRLHTKSMSCQRQKSGNVYTSLLKLSERKYKNKFIYSLFINYKNINFINKLFRPISNKIDDFLYDKLFVKKEITIIKEP